MHQSTWKSFGDASEMCWKSMEFDAAGSYSDTVVEVMTGGEQNKDSLVVAAFGWVSQNHLHWLLSREVLHFPSAQVVGIGLSQ